MALSCAYLALAACVHKASPEESVVQWFCQREPKDPHLRVARGGTVGLYRCRVGASPLYLGDRDAGCDGERSTTELRLAAVADRPGQLWVEEYLIPECLAYDRDWLLGKDLLERTDGGLRALRSITY